MRLRYCGLIICLLALSGFTKQPPMPELPTGRSEKPLVKGKHSMIVTNEGLASDAAQSILDQGGNAVDAAISAAFVLGLTEPESSGVGGGGYALTYVNKKLTAFDGREMAPSTATPELFQDTKGNPLEFGSAMLSPQAVGIPGEVALLYKMHKQHGKLAWKKLLQPAIDLANKGFPMGERLFIMLNADKAILKKNASIMRIYFDSNDTVKPIGHLVVNHDYAKSLTLIAADPQMFYTGRLAEDIINEVNKQAKKTLLSKQDFASYQVLTHEAVCSKYRTDYTVCSVPPSSGGGVTMQELLGIYALNYNGDNSTDPLWAYHFLEASKLAYADRNQYLADPAFVKQPIKGLLDPSYLAKRAKLVTETALAVPVSAGQPAGIDPLYAPDKGLQGSGTTSITVVDKDGNAVSMTVTVEHQFGSHLFVDGFFLNNELTDFSFESKNAAGKPIANRVEADKRPRSSISASLLFDKNNQLLGVVGSPGGSQIICYVAKSIIQMLDMHMTPREASASGNLCAPNADPELEINTPITAFKAALLKKGESIFEGELVSGETNILRDKDGWLGAADPRRQGKAVGG